MNSRVIFSFLVIGGLIGFLFSVQLRADVPVNSLYPGDQLEARESLLKNFIDEQIFLQNRMIEVRKEIEDQQQKNDEIISRSKLSLLEDLKEKNGLSMTKGKGITIVLDDSPSSKRDEILEQTEEGLVQAADLRDIVNLLRTSSVSAIAVNQQRIIASSSIVALGSSILVNNFHLTPPFIIATAGDPDFLFKRFQDPTTLAHLKRRSIRFQMPFRIRREEQVVIPAYSGSIDFQLLSPQNL